MVDISEAQWDDTVKYYIEKAKGVRGGIRLDDLIKPKDIGRNDLCYCGSLKKYKKCCMK